LAPQVVPLNRENPDLERQLQEARTALEEITQRRDQLSRNYYDLEKGAGYARADAGCIERGEPMKFEPTRFIGL
jgi:cell division protein FtsB